MGVLDEAIREHLELKRRRGADTSEVERQEKEAFGPTERQEVPTAEAPEPPAADLHAALDEPGSFAAGGPAAEGGGSAPPEAPTRLHVADASPDPSAPVPPAAEPPGAEALPHDGELETEPPRPHGDPADR